MIGLIATAAVVVVGVVALLIFRSRSRSNDETRRDEAAKKRG